ncbi:hypothetical protein HG537_0E05140 [Torulaspora globosa]|uniref:LSM2-LSM8 complex subunit LSM8 n=1 Tax=Torulaspora globosa TaxID=48254 RepID=A0A7H9HV77_9SACH|nr:hypothetical protein HG537_0E05140 [Torulaspora sp. CBS 2947]
MSPLLKDYLNQRIVIVTTDGDCYIATLEGYDKSVNLLISDVRRRCDGELVSIALTLRGSEVVLCGLLAEDQPEKLGPLPMLKDTKNKIPDEYLIWEEALKASSCR